MRYCVLRKKDLDALCAEVGAENVQPDCEDECGCTMLSYVALFNETEMIRAIVALGGDVNKRDARGFTPLRALMDSCAHSDSVPGAMALLLAKTQLLLELGADPTDGPPDTEWPVTAAARNASDEQWPLIQLFLQHTPASLTSVDPVTHMPPVHYLAADARMRALAQMPVEALVCRDASGCTPLHLVAGMGASRLPVAHRVLEVVPDAVVMRDSRGLLAHDLARGEEMKRLLDPAPFAVQTVRGCAALSALSDDALTFVAAALGIARPTTTDSPPSDAQHDEVPEWDPSSAMFSV